MIKINLFVFSTFLGFQTFSQSFISDSLMSIYFESGFADKKFMPEGKSNNDVRIGKWEDYTFEFVLTYTQHDDIVDEYLDHLLIHSVGKYTDGKKNGSWKFNAIEGETFKKYHIADVTYKDDIKEGPATFYYSSGEKASEVTYVNDLLEGQITVFYKTGEILRKSEAINDKLQGKVIHFYRSGEKEVITTFIDGIRQGEEISFYKNGNVKRKRTYIADTLQGDSKVFYSNGNIQEEGSFKDGELNYIKYFYESGQLWVYKEYRDGKYYNVVELYDSKGKPLDYGTLKNGTGTVKYYTEDAKIYLIETYEEGNIIHKEEFK